MCSLCSSGLGNQIGIYSQTRGRNSQGTKGRLVDVGGRVASFCYFAVNSRLALVTPFATVLELLFPSVTRPIVLFMRLFLLVRYSRYSIAIDRLCTIVYLPIVPLCSFIPRSVTMTKTNALSLAIVMYILCRRSHSLFSLLILYLFLSLSLLSRSC